MSSSPRSLEATPGYRENVLKTLNKLTGGETNMVKSYQQNKTADCLCRFAVTSPKPRNAGCPGCYSFQICDISEYVLATVQKHCSWITALPADGERGPRPSPETASSPSTNPLLSVAEATASYSCAKTVSI